MSELLSPAGTIEAFKAAIANGANAIYLGLDKYSARAYANNFTLESLKPLLDFAHLRNVKIYVTINTIVYDDELCDVYQTIDQLAHMGVDAIIVQDLAVAHYIINHYSSLHAHASTQMGVDDLDAAELLKDIGFKRIVFARETPLETIKNIKKQTNLEVEAFVHGALCVSYSGNCYMSSSIGERSGNRGRCAGCCRKFYSLIDLTTNKAIKNGYLLSMKDLNVSSEISDMSFIDSYKIEGRMKEPNYVASVTNVYRHLIDKEPINISDLDKVFNRTYTKGFMNGGTASDITNIERPNNYGYLIGTIIKQNKETIWIRLNKELAKGDQIRIENPLSKDEISVPVLKLFDGNFNELESANKVAVISCRQNVTIGAKVYKTKDAKFIKNAEESLYKNEYKKLPIDMVFDAKVGKNVLLKVNYDGYISYAKSDFIIEAAKTCATSRDNIINQLSKLNDTPYYLQNIDVNMDDNCFIPLRQLNELRREAIAKLDSQRLYCKVVSSKEQEIHPEQHGLQKPEITVEVTTLEQYQVAKELGIKHIYFNNIIRRNNAIYPEIEGEVLVNGFGGIHHYLKTNQVVSDSSLNVVNHVSAAILSSLGVNRITLSQEISKEKIKELIDLYQKEYKTYPNLELIVYGRSKIMHTKYCPLKRLGKCGECKKSAFALRDEFASFPLMFNDDCTITLLNSKALNIMDEALSLSGINFFRLVFTVEDQIETKNIIESFIDKMMHPNNKSLFKPDKHTRGHFIKNPL